MTRSNPHFFKQETRYSCAPACLRMVLDSLGISLSEIELRRLTDCSPLGTEALQIVKAARDVGCRSSQKHTLGSVKQLGELIAQGFFPIVYVDMCPISGGLSGQHHSLVVIDIGAEDITVLDPLFGEKIMSLGEFDAAWSQMHRLTILISP